MKLQHINREHLHARCSYLLHCLSYSLPSSLLTMCSIGCLFFRSISTHCSPISMHTFNCWRELASSEEYLDTMCSIVQLWRTYKIGIRYISWCYKKKRDFLVSNHQVVLSYALHSQPSSWQTCHLCFADFSLPWWSQWSVGPNYICLTGLRSHLCIDIPEPCIHWKVLALRKVNKHY